MPSSIRGFAIRPFFQRVTTWSFDRVPVIQRQS
jgi:hypothetical protein